MRLDKTIITHNIKSPETVRGVKSPVWGDIIGEITQQKDLTDFINELISDIKYEIPSIEGYATEQWVEDKGYLTEHQQLKTINGETITGNGDIKVSGATETWVEEQISTKVDRSDVYVKSEIDNQINTLRGEIPSTAGLATEQWVESKGYLTQHQDLSGYVEKSEINDFVSITELENSLQHYATKEYVDDIINELNTITLDILS